MRYLLAILIPPLALLLYGKFFQFLINLVLWAVVLVLCVLGIGLFLLWVPAMHAILVFLSAKSDKRFETLVDAIKTSK